MLSCVHPLDGTISTAALAMTEFLNESELPEGKAFVGTFIREIVVIPGKAVVRYTVPIAADSHSPGRDSEEVPLDGSAKSAASEASCR